MTAERLKALTEKAESGDIAAQFLLGLRYKNGYGVEKDEEKALVWFQKAADGNHAGALFRLGEIVQKKDKLKGLQYCVQAANLGYCDSGISYAILQLNFLTVCLAWDDLKRKLGFSNMCTDKVLEDLKQKQDDIKQKQDVRVTIGDIRRELDDIRQELDDDKRELDDIRRELDDFKCKLDDVERRGHDGYRQNNVKILTLQSFSSSLFHGRNLYDHELAALTDYAEQGDAECQWLLGGYWSIHADYRKAVYWFRKAAEQGDKEAQCALGNCYKRGRGVEAPDAAEAVKWYRRAADQGDSNAMCALGNCYENGLGVEQDLQKAAEYYEDAADFKSADGLFHLGRCYEEGIGVVQDKRKAIELYRQIKEPKAYYRLGEIYENGEGTEQDRKEAMRWYLRAAKEGNNDAQYRLMGLISSALDRPEEVTLWLIDSAKAGNQEAKILLEDERIQKTREREEEAGIANAQGRHDVFISWNHCDKAFKNALTDEIEGYEFNKKTGEKICPRFRAWESDRDATGELVACLQNAITLSKFFVVIVSPSSVKSKWVELEVQKALDLVKCGSWGSDRIIPVYLCEEGVSYGELLGTLGEGTPFRYLHENWAGVYVQKDDPEELSRAVNDICVRIKKRMEDETLANYVKKQTTENTSFRFTVGMQYNEGIGKELTVNGFISTQLSFETGYLPRKLYVNGETPVEADAVMESGSSFFLFGEGGIGKSLFLSQMIKRYFKKDTFFLRVNLLELDRENDFSRISELDRILDFALNCYRAGAEEYQSEISVSRIRKEWNSLCLVFDGLDEISLQKRDRLIRLIESYLKTGVSARNRFIFVARTTSCFDSLNAIFGGKLNCCQIMGLNRKEQEALYNSIRANVHYKKTEKSDEVMKQEFFNRLDGVTDELSNDLAQNPLLLSNLIFIYLQGRGASFPATKYAVIEKSVEISLRQLEESRGIRCDYSEYLVGGKIDRILEYVAYKKADGCGYDCERLIVEYFKRFGSCNEPEIVGKGIYEYLSRRGFISFDKVAHDLFSAYFTCCYLFRNIYRISERKNYLIEFRGAEGKELFLHETAGGENGNLSREDGSWPEISSELIMKLDYEIHALKKLEMDRQHPSYHTFRETLVRALKKKGFGQQAIAIVRALTEKDDGFYYAEFIRKFLR